eukprot:TRINITY_DN392_c0_g1_i1.p1 TRINITY_DN392_c0_g1~~TRINITY_DN392_c0_g1_i1.p1  ORF type:complete len:373 (+),score=105.46 TRINITY_DN392_c0_g1_i1:51-1121(+)
MDKLFKPEEIGKTCLITGGSGFVGRRLIEILHEIGCEVINFDLFQSWDEKYCKYIKGDLTKYEQVFDALKGVDTVFHVAAVIALSGKEDLMDKVNVEGTKNLIKASKEQGVSKLIYTSTSSVSFHGKDVLDVEEKNKIDVESIPRYGGFYYNRTKSIAESLVLDSNSKELLTCSIRPHSIYGPRDGISWPSIIEKALEGKFKFILGDGKNLTSTTHVDNCVYGHLLAAAKLKDPKSAPSGNAYHVNDGKDVGFWENMKFISVGMGVKEANFGKFGIPADVGYYIAYTNELLHYYCESCIDPKKKGPTVTRMSMLNATKNHTYSIEKAKKDLGYKPIIDFDTAMKTTLQWFQENYKK